MIKKAKDLNARYIRFDIWWKDVEPQKDQFNENAFEYYRAIINKIHQEGMDVIVVLGSSGGFPSWVNDLLEDAGTGYYIAKVNDRIVKIPTGRVNMYTFLKIAKENRIPIKSENLYIVNGKVVIQARVTPEFLDEAKEYASKVAQELGDLITYYQLGNELNHPADPIQMWDDPKYIKALYDGISEHDYYFKTIVNAFADWPWWDYWLKYWLNTAGSCIDIVAIDHYPGTWSYQSYDHWNELDTLFSIADQYGKQAAVMETGYTTYWLGGAPVIFADVPHSETKQKNFINSALPAIRQKVKQHHLAFVTWYELVDEPNAGPLPAEKEFGICKSDLTPKLGYSDLKYQFSLFG